MTRLGTVVEINPPGPPPGGRVSLISMADIDPLSATAVPRLPETSDEAGSARRPAREGDVLFARISPSMENGKVAIVPKLETEVALVSGELIVLRPRAPVDPRMIWAFLRQEALLRRLAQLTTGSAGYKRLDRKVLERVELPEIGGSRWGAASQALERLDRAGVLRRSAIELLRGLPGMAMARGAAGAPRAPLGRFDVELRPGTGERSVEAGDVPMLRNPNIVDGSVNRADLRYVPAQPATKIETLRRNDLLIVRSSGSSERFARAAVYEDEPPRAGFASSLVRVRSDNGPSADFLWAWLQTEEARNACLARATASNRYNLTLAALRDLPVPDLAPAAHDRLSLLARHLRLLIAACNRQGDLIGEAVQAHLTRAFAGTNVPLAGGVARPAGPVRGVPASLQPVFEAASEAQQKTWLQTLTMKGAFRLTDLRQPDRNRYQLQHTLLVLEQLGVLVKERDGAFEQWRVPDVETEVIE